MSFTSVQKQYIISQPYKSPCCRKALLFGTLFAKGEYNGKNEITVSVGSRDIAEFLSKFILEFFGVTPNIGTSPNGGRRVLLTFVSKTAANYLSNISNGQLFTNKCDFCVSSFLRGVFLACGRIADPKKQYFLELSLGERCEPFTAVLQSIGTTPKYIDKKTKVEGEFKKSAMRVANCETGNISRAVYAASRQLEIIRALDKANLLSSLPDELEATARLRLEHADMSLFQLSAISVPHISKPGLSHRLNRIIEIGEQLLSKRGINLENQVEN